VGEPRFVVSIDAGSGTVVVGPRDALLVGGCALSDVSWVGGSPPDRDDVEVQIRYRSGAVPARLVAIDDGWHVWFEEPQEAVASGQAGVVYRGDEVLGGGTITTALQGVAA